jgi:formyltetrahydrofolate hydrolase
VTQSCLLISTQDEKGLVHKITGVLFRRGLNIIENALRLVFEDRVIVHGKRTLVFE